LLILPIFFFSWNIGNRQLEFWQQWALLIEAFEMVIRVAIEIENKE
jgi:hypothetical protein